WTCPMISSLIGPLCPAGWNVASARVVEAGMSEPIKVDVWSDIACPWCYIGKRKFEEGVRRFAASASASGEAPAVEVTYHSFELAPDTPVDFEGSEVDFLAHHKGLP